MSPRGPDRLVTGLFLGAAIAFIIAAIIDNQIGVALKEEWPNLLISVATVFAAIYAARIALKGPQAQIEQQRKIEERRENARRSASRALLPIIASQIHVICSDAIQFSFQPEDFFKKADDPEQITRKLELSHTTLEQISRCLETAQLNEGVILQVILAKHQVCLARMRTRFDKSYVDPHDITSIYHAVDWAILRGFSNHLYKLGRLNSHDLDDYLDAKKFNFPDTPKQGGNLNWILIEKVEDQLAEWVEDFKGVKISKLKEVLFRGA